jgi:glycine/D-amino acid oxidase-like deaminating enzyme
MIAVIGTGIVGACVGYHLARAGADVMLVDGGWPGRLTTNATFAWVNASSKIDHPAYFELNFAGLKEYERLVAESSDQTWWHPSGHLRWDYASEGELVSRVQQLQERGYAAEVWEANRVQRVLEPSLSFASPSSLVAVLPSEGWVDGPGMVEALVAMAVRRGARVTFRNALRGIAVENGAVIAIQLRCGQSYAVDAVVNAAGPAAAGVAALIGRALPMREQPGLAVRVKTSEDRLHRVIHPPGIAIRPDGRRRVFLLARSVEPALGGNEHDPNDLAESVKRVASRVLPELASASVVDARVGHRPLLVDGLPAIGRARDVDGYYEAVTHSGITLGPILGRLLATEILHGRIDPLVAPFRADRLDPP